MSSPKPRAVLHPVRRVLVKRSSITRPRRRFIIPATEKYGATTCAIRSNGRLIFTRETYSPERVSTLITSPICTNSGTLTTAPVDRVAGLPPVPAVSPFRLGRFQQLPAQRSSAELRRSADRSTGSRCIQPVQQPFSVIAYRFLVCSQLFESGVIHKVPELTVAIQEGQVHVGYVCAFSGVSRLEGFLYASTGQQATQLNARKRGLYGLTNSLASTA